MLSGYMLFSFVRHPDLTAGAMYLPLVALGIERVVQKKAPFLLTISGKIRMHYIKILEGDTVKIEMSPYDITKGRITYRNKN